LDTSTIRFVEELSLNAWPALQTNLVDGWLLRLSAGYTRRANSVQPLYPGRLPLVEKVQHCEEVFQRVGIAPCFKLTGAAEPAGLDGYLAANGYQREAETSVQLAAIVDLPATNARGLRLNHTVTPQWCAAFAALTGIAAKHLPTMQTMLEALTPAAVFASVKLDGRLVATGLAVVERECAGLFDLAVDPNHRRQGLATAMASTLCRWAADAHGTQTAYLQVVADNEPALSLYRRLGFVEAYRYWYRIKASSR